MARLHGRSKYLSIADLVINKGTSIRQAARMTGVSYGVAQKTITRVRKGLDPEPACNKGMLYSNRKITHALLAEVHRLYTSPDTESLYLDEAARMLQPLSERRLTAGDIHRACKQLGITRKQKHTIFREADPMKQDIFKETMRRLVTKEMLVWTDESAVVSVCIEVG
ncbi:hypothetical protein PLESTB_001386300 [Pleodorina starrii]|uniref:Uncharacterized protein n=1 Tax=Pleodorina starrii TaxID=330485 RepID=A0A9W6BTL0_9CHLO|nr:hypothetical protein PLESTB_001258500 [Pleodorina starrii]GLC58666.1 hypothetical protein PLESTB_001386000 [Pleodorina starrii]GLC58669.1 hypothetical protein PLESTB_001386300 [Pleodorina starrii]